MNGNLFLFELLLKFTTKIIVSIVCLKKKSINSMKNEKSKSNLLRFNSIPDSLKK